MAVASTGHTTHNAPSSALAALRERHAGRHVLVADDDPVNQEVAQAMLDAALLRVTLVADGEAAETAALAGDVDLVLMDVHMPRTDGLTATRRLRAAGFGLPIVALTASAYVEDKRQCQEAGMDGFLTKPFEIEALYATVLEALERRGAAAPGAAATSGVAS